MSVPGIGSVSVIGAGTMGAQIGMVTALAGYPVRLVGRSGPRLLEAMVTNRRHLSRRVEKTTLDQRDLDRACSRITTTTDLAEGLTGADLVIESVAEDRVTKEQVLAAVCRHISESAVIGSNSSTLASSMFAGSVTNPGRLINLHFFNPALVMPLVEVVRGQHTGDRAAQLCMDFARDIGKTPVLLEKESYGFIVNRILFIALQEAFGLVEAGHVSMADCDLAVTGGLGWPMGPFELADLVGLDVVQAILEEGRAQTGDERWAPGPILRDRVAHGALGRKSGSGLRYGTG